jgi:hypothetical protein
MSPYVIAFKAYRRAWLAARFRGTQMQIQFALIPLVWCAGVLIAGDVRYDRPDYPDMCK